MKHIIDISIIIPVFNEEDSIVELNNQIISSISEKYAFEIIYINDGSTDSSKNIIENILKNNSHIKLISFYKNRGKSAALNHGFKMSSGDIIITLDADLQDDPKEINNFIDKINEGYGLVSGWKKNRLDPISKKMPSKIFSRRNKLFISLVWRFEKSNFSRFERNQNP